jgi:hypothetical protein
MKYELTTKESQQLSSGELITHAAYDAQSAALCQYAADYNGIKFRAVLSESPTGKRIFIFLFYPDTFYKAYRLGDMLARPELYYENYKELLKNVWEERFNVN